MQLVINTQQVAAIPAAIEFNYEALKAELDGLLDRYRNLLVENTKDGIRAAKEDRANLNKLRDVLEDARKEVKAKCLAPYKQFEEREQTLIAMIEDVTAPLDKQLKAIDEARKQQRLVKLSDDYDAHSGIAAFMPFEKVVEKTWLNASVTDERAKAAMDAAVSRIKSDIASIQSMAAYSEALRKDAVARYCEERDLGGALAWMQNRKAMDEAIAEQARKAAEAEAARRAQEAEIQPAPPPVRDPVMDATPGQVEADTAEAEALNRKPADEDPVMTFTLRFTGKRSALFQMATWMRDHGVTYVKLNAQD